MEFQFSPNTDPNSLPEQLTHIMAGAPDGNGKPSCTPPDISRFLDSEGKVKMRIGETLYHVPLLATPVSSAPAVLAA